MPLRDSMSYSVSDFKFRIHISKLIGLITVLLLFAVKVNGQSLGDPIVDITFGSGAATHAGALAVDSGFTTYNYSTGAPNDGFYTIVNNTSGLNPGWFVTSDHTGNQGGYMMIVNGSYDPGIFYTRTVTGLCGGTKYQFAAWIKNLLNYNGILPNVSFSIETSSGTVLGSGNTGDIGTGNVWIQYPFTFTTPVGTDNIVIKMTNNASGGAGNDIAIDDITFRPYGAQVSTVFSQSATSQNLCAGTSQAVSINTTTSLAAGYEQKVQLLVNSVWTDQSAPSTSSNFTINSPALAGVYYYRVVSALAANISSSECVVSSNELTLTVNAPPNALFSVPDTICMASAAIFRDKSTTGAGTINKWLWNFGDGQTDTTQNPAHIYANAGIYTVKLIVSNNIGCSSAVSEIVNINPFPVPAFTYSTPACATKAITLTDESTTPTGSILSWLWDYGDGTTETKSTSQAFQHTYTTAGTYTIKLTVTGNLGCISSITKKATINPLPVVNFGTPDVCIHDAFAVFTDSTTVADSTNGSFTYLWNFGDANATALNPNTSLLQNPSHKYTQAAIYQVTLTVTSKNGCTSTLTKSFTVNGAVPVAAFTVLNQGELCSNREVFLTNQSTVDFGNITRVDLYYDYGNNPTIVETDNTPYFNKLYRHTYPTLNAGTKNYQVRMLAYSGGTCVAEFDKTITLLAAPVLSFPIVSGICLNAGKLQLMAAETVGVPGAGIYVGAGVTQNGLFDPSVTGTGDFLINYIYTANNACADTISQNITVNAIPSVNAGPDVTILQGGTGTLQASAKGDSLTYLWSPATNLSSATVLNPVVSPGAEDITYTLTATNKNGCSVSDNVTVSVLKSPVIPNSFTPNNDGINDTWVIKYLESYVGCTVDIFNRNGQKVFNSIGYPVPWDGRYNNADLPAGVYYYVINPKHGRKVFSGWVTIIR